MDSVHEHQNKADTLIISDVHCGLGAARVEEATELISKRNFSRLILLGDIIHTTNLRRMRQRDHSFLELLKKIKGEGYEVVWVIGNHDLKLASNKTFLDIPIVEEYLWEENGVTNLALHGHTLYDFTKDSGPFGFAYLASEWLFLFAIGRKASKILKNTFVTKGPSEELTARALAYGKKRNVRRVFCGHTHIELHAKNDAVDYWNSGSWVDEPSQYIEITNGEVEIRYT